MATGYWLANGQQLEDVFAARISAPGSNTGMRDAGGTDIALYFEPRANGADIGFDTGYRNGAGTDFRNLFAAKGSAYQPLSINGASYGANNQQRGRAGIRLQMNNNGTFGVYVQQSSTTNYQLVASGTWLTAGGAGEYSCVFIGKEVNFAVNGSATSHGIDNYAPSQVNLGSNSPYVEGWASAIYTGSNATSSGTLTMQLFRNGTLVSQTQIAYWCNVNGN